jgi:toxin ParE1/3/4
VAKVVWTERATAWLQDIYDYIAQDNLTAAIRTVRAIQEKTCVLEKFPEIGFLFDEMPGRNIRVLLYGHYRIAYEIIDTDRVQILGVFHSALDLERYLF